MKLCQLVRSDATQIHPVYYRASCHQCFLYTLRVYSGLGNPAQHQSETNVHLLSLRDENLPDLRKEVGARWAARPFGLCQPVPASSAPHARPDFSRGAGSSGATEPRRP